MFTVIVTLTVAVVLTLAAVAIARVLTRVFQKAEHRADQAESRADRAERAKDAAGRAIVESHVLKGFAYGADVAQGKLTVENLDGDCMIRRSLVGVRANDGFTVANMSGIVGTSGEVTLSPRLLNMAGLPKDRVSFKSLVKGRAGQFEFSFAPPLKSDDPPFEYTVEVSFERGTLMTRAAIEQQYKDDAFREEYYGIRVDIPVAALELEVVFPPGFQPRVGGTALYGDTEIVADAEGARVAKAVQQTSAGAKVRLEQPLLSYVYAIHWMPPQ